MGLPVAGDDCCAEEKTAAPTKLIAITKARQFFAALKMAYLIKRLKWW
jgi:hypothetical protein